MASDIAAAGAPFVSTVAHTTLDSATAEPTLKSMPPLTMIIVMPSAPTPITAVWLNISTQLRHVKKYGRTSASSANSAITSASPSTGAATVKRPRRSSDCAIRASLTTPAPGSGRAQRP